jgi:hypothetical protein
MAKMFRRKLGDGISSLYSAHSTFLTTCDMLKSEECRLTISLIYLYSLQEPLITLSPAIQVCVSQEVEIEALQYLSIISRLDVPSALPVNLVRI